MTSYRLHDESHVDPSAVYFSIYCTLYNCKHEQCIKMHLKYKILQSNFTSFELLHLLYSWHTLDSSTFISRELLQPGNYLKLPQGKNLLVTKSTFPLIWFYCLRNLAEFRKVSYSVRGRFLTPPPLSSIVVGTCGSTHIFRCDSWFFFFHWAEESVWTSWKVLRKPSWTCMLLGHQVAGITASVAVWCRVVKAPTTHLTCFYCTTL